MNHYSPGAVCAFLFDTVCGIQVKKENHFVIAPVTGGSLTCAFAEYLSPYGLVKSEWKKEEERTVLKVSVPSNCTAEIVLGKEKGTVESGEHTLTI